MNKEGKVLTEKLLLAKTKADTINDVKKFNIWGQKLTDVSILEKLPNVTSIGLSVNLISTLENFSKCLHVQEIFMRSNLISDFSELKHLQMCKNLRVLWLLENPICKDENYRLKVIKILPQIKKLDNDDVSDIERQLSEKINDVYTKVDIEKTTQNSQDSKTENNENQKDDSVSPKDKPETDKHVGNVLPETKSESDKQPNTTQPDIQPPKLEHEDTILDKDQLADAPAPSQTENETKATVGSTNNVDDVSDNSQKENISKTSLGSSRETNEKPAPRTARRKNDGPVLTAILSLLPELSVDSLGIVLRKIREMSKDSKK